MWAIFCPQAAFYFFYKRCYVSSLREGSSAYYFLDQDQLCIICFADGQRASSLGGFYLLSCFMISPGVEGCPLPGFSIRNRAARDPNPLGLDTLLKCVSVRVRACARMCACMYVCECAHTRTRARGHIKVDLLTCFDLFLCEIERLVPLFWARLARKYLHVKIIILVTFWANLLLTSKFSQTLFCSHCGPK